MNIGEIAKRAGVSSAAVSRYFNNGYISEEKREAIRRVLEEKDDILSLPPPCGLPPSFLPIYSRY